MMQLCSLACSVPQTRFRQADLWTVYSSMPISQNLRPGSNELIRKLLTKDNGVDYRHLALADMGALFTLGAEGLNNAFEETAPTLAAEAARKALAQAGVDARQLDALFVCTCTGYLCPGVSSYVAEQLGLRSDVYLQDIAGMGCGAAIPTLRSAAGFCQMHPAARVAVVAVEICSAAFFLEDKGDIIISACLFGDGAAAAVLGGAEGKPSGDVWQFSSFDTVHLPEEREILRFKNHQGKLKNRLARTVPERAGQSVGRLWERFSEESDGAAEIISHAGGKQVLEALAQTLPQPEFPESAWALRHGGNMSSPSVLFALGAYLQTHDTGVPVSLPEAWGTPPQRTARHPDSLWLTSFGAGFAAHSCALRRA
jgi:predicted naringenin-chalcone synthase